jgi:hypothetical protein
MNGRMVLLCVLCERRESYARVIGRAAASGQSGFMKIARFRLAPLAAALALLMVMSAVAPASAAAPKRVWSAEKYALSLLNCTRTGGWVTAEGTCDGRGSGTYSALRPALKRSKGLSRKVAWPWARALTAAEACAHALPGKRVLSKRLSYKGYRHGYFGENIGCGWGGSSPKQVVLSTHRAMQAEKSDNGGHWANMKNAGYKSVGIGVATRGGRTTVVYDFYGKRVY